MQISISILVANATSGISYVKRLVKNFKARVLSYPNSIFEAEPCLVATLTELNNIELLRQSSLVITPNAYNEGVLYDVIPNTPLGDMDVVRATTATRVNSAGLIEVVPRNLLGYSQQFNNAYWNKINLSIVPDSITAPNGTLTASTYIPTASPSQLTVNTILKQTANITYTFSFYIKSAGLTDIRCFIWGSTNTNRGEATFNVVNGSVSAIGSVGGFSNTSATINLVNNGYYLCTITTTSDTSAGVNVNFRYDNTISGASGFYIWGAQLEEGSTATEYFPTTTRLNIPRIDYTNGSCPSLLVEPQRTNLTLYSEQFDNAYWIKDIDVTVNSNASISPSGNLDADRVNFASNNKAIYKNITATGTHRFSIYLKGEGSNIGKQIQLLIGNVGGTVNVTLTSQWQRFTADASTSTYVGVAKIGALQADSVLIWGSQLEAGAYPTSYIPTVASSVTRNADVISKTGVSSLIGQTEGVIFLDCKIYPTDTKRLAINDGTTANAIFFQSDATNRVRFLISQNSATILDTGNFTLANPNAFNKIAFKYKSNDFAIWVNGTNIYSSSAVALSFPVALSKFAFDFSATGLSFFGEVKSAQLYKTALTDEQLTLLTGDLYNSYAEMANSLNYILE